MIDEKQIKIVKSVAEMALGQVEGVIYATDNPVDSTLFDVPLKRSNTGVSCESVGNKLVINLTVSVMNGYPIPELACACQQKVKKEVEKALHIQVKTVNVNVDGIIFKR